MKLFCVIKYFTFRNAYYVRLLGINLAVKRT